MESSVFKTLIEILNCLTRCHATDWNAQIFSNPLILIDQRDDSVFQTQSGSPGASNVLNIFCNAIKFLFCFPVAMAVKPDVGFHIIHVWEMFLLRVKTFKCTMLLKQICWNKMKHIFLFQLCEHYMLRFLLQLHKSGLLCQCTPFYCHGWGHPPDFSDKISWVWWNSANWTFNGTLILPRCFYYYYSNFDILLMLCCLFLLHLTVPTIRWT